MQIGPEQRPPIIFMQQNVDYIVDMIYAVSQLPGKCQEQNDYLFITFIDITVAFDTVCRGWLWLIMGQFRCPGQFTALVRQLHDSMRASVLENGDTSD